MNLIWFCHRNLNDESTIEKIMTLRESEKNDWWNEISNEERISIEKGNQDANAGKLNSHSKARDLYEKWL